MAQFDLSDKQAAVIRIGISLLFSLLLFALIAFAWLGLHRLEDAVALPLLLSIASLWLPSPLSSVRPTPMTPDVHIQMAPGEYGPTVMSTADVEPLRRGTWRGPVQGPVHTSGLVNAPVSSQTTVSPKEK